jgi:indole-3-glycerol phosphate synthase
MSSNFLNAVLEYKKRVIACDRRAEPLTALKRRIARLPAPRSDAHERPTGTSGRRFAIALATGSSGIIAEIKRRSPRVKSFANASDIKALARVYEQNGAAAISVLTDNKFFGGSLADLQEVKATVNIPVLRKDFIIDEYQIYQSRAYGADAILLIAAILSKNDMAGLLQLSNNLGLETLVEVHNESELKTVIDVLRRGSPVRVIGINSRNLATLKMDMKLPARLLPLIPNTLIKVVESGIKTAAQIKRFRSCGADGFLIGGALLKAPSPGKRLRQLIYGKS